MVFWGWAEDLHLTHISTSSSSLTFSTYIKHDAKGGATYRKNNRYPSPNSFTPIQFRRFTQPEVLFAVTLPTYHCCAVEQDLH